MKKIMIALALVGFTFAGAEAQTKGTCGMTKKHVVKKKTVRKTNTGMTAATYGKTYQVCRDEGGYNICCIYSNTATTRKSW